MDIGGQHSPPRTGLFLVMGSLTYSPVEAIQMIKQSERFTVDSQNIKIQSYLYLWPTKKILAPSGTFTPLMRGNISLLVGLQVS